MIDAERDLPVMAFSTKFTLLDGLHGYDRCPFYLLREHPLVMTVVTCVASLQMLVSMEYRLVRSRIALIDDILHGGPAGNPTN